MEQNQLELEHKSRTELIFDLVQRGVRDFMENDDLFKQWLKVSAKMSYRSVNNRIMIALQKPDASLVLGYTDWEKKFHRHVKKGEKGITIIAPAPYKKEVEVPVIDESGNPQMDKNGNALTETKEKIFPAFKTATVFDISQTEGPEIPYFELQLLDAKVNNFNQAKEILNGISHVPISFEIISSGANGYYSHNEQRIAIQEGMPELQTIKTMIHEIAHSYLHNREGVLIEGVTENNLTAHTKEVEAEAVAFIVCEHFGLDTSDYSFGYIASWSSGQETKELKESMQNICIASDFIISKIEKSIVEIKEKEFQETDHYEIFQLKDSKENENIHFKDLDEIMLLGKSVSFEQYRKTYQGHADENTNLNGLFEQFNINRPEDFEGHSISVSDVIILQKDGQREAFFVTKTGFTEIHDFENKGVTKTESIKKETIKKKHKSK